MIDDSNEMWLDRWASVPISDFGTIETGDGAGLVGRWCQQGQWRWRGLAKGVGGDRGDGGVTGQGWADSGSQPSQRTHGSGSDSQILRPDLCKWSWIVQPVVGLVHGCTHTRQLVNWPLARRNSTEITRFQTHFLLETTTFGLFFFTFNQN